MPVSINRKIYADMYGPTTGDKMRLADTELFIEVEKDLTTYGDEVKLGAVRLSEMVWVKPKPRVMAVRLIR